MPIEDAGFLHRRLVRAPADDEHVDGQDAIITTTVMIQV